MANFQAIAERAGRVGRSVTAVGKLLLGVGFGAWSVVEIVQPVHYTTTTAPSWVVSLVEHVAQHTGLSSQTAALWLWRLLWVGVAALAVHAAKEAWEEWEHGGKAFVGALAGCGAIIGVVALLIVGAPLHGAAAAGNFYYPLTLAACGWPLYRNA
jgi:hypothetical protein